MKLTIQNLTMMTENKMDTEDVIAAGTLKFERLESQIIFKNSVWE
jgi:hypothetical protein